MKSTNDVTTYVTTLEGDSTEWHRRTFVLEDSPVGPMLLIKDSANIVHAAFAPGMWQFASVR